MTTESTNIQLLIERFSSEQTLKNIGELRNFGVGLKILKNKIK